jgi:hypothetical protein
MSKPRGLFASNLSMENAALAVAKAASERDAADEKDRIEKMDAKIVEDFIKKKRIDAENTKINLKKQREDELKKQTNEITSFNIDTIKKLDKNLANVYGATIPTSYGEESSIITEIDAEHNVKNMKQNSLGFAIPMATLAYILRYLYDKMINEMIKHDFEFNKSKFNPQKNTDDVDHNKNIVNKLFNELLNIWIDNPRFNTNIIIQSNIYDGRQRFHIYIKEVELEKFIFLYEKDMFYLFIITRKIEDNIINLNSKIANSKRHLSIPKREVFVNDPKNTDNKYTHFTFDERNNKRRIYFKANSVEGLLQTLIIYNNLKNYIFFMKNKANWVETIEKHISIKDRNITTKDILDAFNYLIPSINDSGIGIFNFLANVIKYIANDKRTLDYNKIVIQQQTIFNEKIKNGDSKLIKAVNKLICDMLNYKNVSILLEKINNNKMITDIRNARRDAVREQDQQRLLQELERPRDIDRYEDRSRERSGRGGDSNLSKTKKNIKSKGIKIK